MELYPPKRTKVFVTKAQKDWVIQQAKKNQTTQSGYLRTLIQQNLQNHRPLPALPQPEEPYTDNLCLELSSYQRTAMLYREDTISTYIRKLIALYQSADSSTGGATG